MEQYDESVSKSFIKIKIDAAGNVGETAIRFAANDAWARRIYTHIFTLLILFGRKTELPHRHHNIDDAHSDQNAHNDAKDTLKQLKDLHVQRVLPSANAKCRSKQENEVKQL